jgi:hypothetical protein
MSPSAMGLIALLVILALYMLPTFVAATRGKQHGLGGVVCVNIFPGWTLVGWVVAFIWACSGSTEVEARREEQRHREMLEAIARKDMRALRLETRDPKDFGPDWDAKVL